jgi:hypothetical protein
VRLSVQEEMVDASQIRGCFYSRDQQFANPKTSIRSGHGDATNFGRRAAIPEHNARCPDRPAISQRHEMKGRAIILIALQIGRNVLFADKDLFSNPKALFQVLRRVCGSNCCHRRTLSGIYRRAREARSVASFILR